MRTCLDCKTVIDESNEVRSGKHLKSRCRPCHNEWRKAYYKRDHRQDTRLQSTYGITLAQYQQMHDSQRGLCFICSSNEKLFVDHCHETGQVRGLLCHHCNVMLGHAKDRPELLRLAASYLENNDRSINTTE